MKQGRLLVNIAITTLLIINKCGISFVTIDKNDKLDLLIVENLSIVSNKDSSMEHMKNSQLTAMKELLLSNSIIVQKLNELDNKLTEIRLGPFTQMTLTANLNKTAPADDDKPADSSSLSPEDRNKDESKNDKSQSRTSAASSDKRDKNPGANIKDKLSHPNPYPTGRFMKDNQTEKKGYPPPRSDYMLVGKDLNRQMVLQQDTNHLETQVN